MGANVAYSALVSPPINCAAEQPPTFAGCAPTAESASGSTATCRTFIAAAADASAAAATASTAAADAHPDKIRPDARQAASGDAL